MSETKTRSISLDGHFLKGVIHEYPNGARRLDVVYLESPTKTEVILTEQFASHELLYKAFVEGLLTADLSARARKLVPAIGTREEKNLDEMADLQFEALDVRCDNCGARPGEPCPSKGCQEGRVEGLHHFLIWLAEQCHRQPKLTKKLIIDVAEMLGYNTAENLYYRGPGVVVTSWSTGNCWRLYVGGRLDPTKSIWMTRGMDLVNPERGPLRDTKEITIAIRTVGRERATAKLRDGKEAS